MLCMILVGVLLMIISYLYIERSKNAAIWKNKGIKYVPADSFLGLINKLRKKSNFEHTIDLYKNFPNERYFGAFNMTMPLLIIKDPALIKKIVIKDSEYFINHKSFVPNEIDAIWTRFLLSSRGEKWKKLRSTMTPAFTGSKMKLLYVFMEECAEKFVKYISEKEESIVEVEMKDMFSRYTNDVIANTVFGVTCNSLEDRDNEFYKYGKKGTSFGGEVGLRFMMYGLFPELAKLIKLQLFPSKIRNYFLDIIKHSIKAREEKTLVRRDMLQLLIDAYQGRLNFDENDVSATKSSSEKEENEMEPDDLVAQAYGFFLAGFESTSGSLCFLAYELVVNTECQEKLREEVDRVDEEVNGKINYEALSKMKYLEMVVLENLRKWPTIPVTDREVHKTYVIPPERPGEQELVLEPGISAVMNICGMQRDPEFFPNPDKFDPERFSDENKRNIIPLTFMPFGGGPRGCIGERFALLEIKTIMYHLIKHFEIVPIEKTEIPIKLQRTHITVGAANGFHFGLKKRR